MKRQFLLTRMLLLFALIVGSVNGWAQTDYSASYTGNITLSTTGGTNVSECTVNISSTDYNGIKAGTGKKVGAVKITVPKDTKYLHLHVAAWTGESTTSIVVTPAGYSDNITLTANTGIAGSTTAYTFGTASGDKNPNSSDHYKVITFSSALAANTDLTFTASGNNRFVIWGVYSEVESSDPSSNASFVNTAPSINYPATKTYSQAPTTAAGYSGTISYSMTANTAGASINASTGLVTVTQGGSVTVKAIAAAVPGSFSGSEASYTLTVNDTRATLSDEQLAWSAASASVTYGAGDNVFPTLTNTEDVTVTYTSSNQAAATIDENTGAITLKDYTGNTTISAIFAGNDDYKAKTVEYTLNVTKAPFAVKDGVFDFVEAADADEDYGSGMVVSDSYTTTNKTWTAGNVTMVTSRVSGNGYRWYTSDNTLRFYNESNATFSVPSGYVITKIVTTGANFDSSVPNGLSGTTWTGASNSVKLTATATRNIKTITITYTTANQTITPVKPVTTYVTTQKLDFTEVDGLKAYIATSKGTNTVNMTAVDAPVPAGTALLLKKTSGTSFNVPVVASATAPTTNYLKAGPVTFTGSETAKYILKDGEFYLAAAGNLAAGKAYLDLTEFVAGARQLSIVFDDEETTGISNVDITKPEVKDNVYYNLNGQRVANPSKGLFIVNGKKVMINK